MSKAFIYVYFLLLVCKREENKTHGYLRLLSWLLFLQGQFLANFGNFWHFLATIGKFLEIGFPLTKAPK